MKRNLRRIILKYIKVDWQDSKSAKYSKLIYDGT